MGALRRKLHSTRGASFVLALLFFLVCLTVSALILTAATGSTARTKDRYADQQDYLAAASAARLLRETLGTYTYTTGQTWQTWIVGTDEETGEPITESGWVDISPFVSPADGRSGDLLTDAYRTLGGTSMAAPRTFTIQAENMPDVTVSFLMGADGSAQLDLTCGEHAITLSFTARTANVADYMTYDYQTTSWSEGVITKARW